MTANFSEYSIFKSTKLLKIVDVYGREVTNATNQVLFYIYDNGYSFLSISGNDVFFNIKKPEALIIISPK